MSTNKEITLNAFEQNMANKLIQARVETVIARNDADTRVGLVQVQLLMLQAQRAELVAALGKLRLEALHFLRNNIGAEHMEAAINDAECLLAKIGGSDE